MMAAARDIRQSTGQHGPCLHLLLAPGLEAVQALQRFSMAGDAVVLLGTAVVLLANDDHCRQQLSHGLSVYALCADVLAQGLQPLATEAGIAQLDDTGLLNLVAQFPHSLSWK